MKNLLNYLKAYSKVSFEESPLNELDIALFTQLTYIDFNSISFDNEIKYSLKALMKLYFVERDKTNKYLGLIIPRDVIPAIRKMSNSPRYKSIKVSDYINKINLSTEEQFGAITIDIDKSKKLIVYGGTDDHIVGWKEDFNSLYLATTPAQYDALNYLNGSAQKDKKNIITAGHSKGGNLAMYASINAPQDIQDRILKVYNLDGQGFLAINSNKKFDEMYARIISICPRGSIVGRLFDHTETPNIVNSIGVGLFQHDIFTWEIKDNTFVYIKSFDEISEYINILIKDILKDMTLAQKENFIDSLFDFLHATDSTTLTELYGKPFSIITSYIMLKAEKKVHLKQVMKTLLASKDFRKLLFDTFFELRKITKQDEKVTK